MPEIRSNGTLSAVPDPEIPSRRPDQPEDLVEIHSSPSPVLPDPSQVFRPPSKAENRSSMPSQPKKSVARLETFFLCTSSTCQTILSYSLRLTSESVVKSLFIVMAACFFIFSSFGTFKHKVLRSKSF